MRASYRLPKLHRGHLKCDIIEKVVYKLLTLCIDSMTWNLYEDDLHSQIKMF